MIVEVFMRRSPNRSLRSWPLRNRCATLHDTKSAGNEGAIGQGRVAGRVGPGNMEIAEGRGLVDENVTRKIARHRGPAGGGTAFRGSQHGGVRCIDGTGDRS